MRNCIILGSGRSGTSMLAGTLAKSGYYMGGKLLPTTDSNPKGFFEDVEINGINEELLAQVVPKRPQLIGNLFFRHRPLPWQRWLSQVPVDKKITSTLEINDRIQNVTQHEPYCFKDPRFSYTLSAWKPFLKNTVFLCVFRHPATTAESILKECQNDVRLHSLAINFHQALEVWILMYKHILEIHRHDGQWLFLHYNQVLGVEGLTRLEAFTGASVDCSFPENSLRRSFSNNTVSKEIQEVYQKLCELSGYDNSEGKS